MTIATKTLLACTLLTLGACAAPTDDDLDSESAEYREANTPSPSAPPRVGDLAMWLDPEVNLSANPYNGANVYGWRDRAGKAQVQTDYRLLTTTLGKRHGVRFPNRVMMTATLAKNLGTRPFTILMVASATRSGPLGRFFRLNDSGGNYLGLWLEPYEQVVFDYTMPLGPGPTSGYAIVPPILHEQPHVITLRRSGPHVTVFIDDTPTYTATGTNTYNAYGVGGREEIQLGGIYDSDPGPPLSTHASGDFLLGDVLVYDAELSDADVVNAKKYLSGHYGL